MIASPNRIFITGSSGWLGKRLARLIAEGAFRNLVADDTEIVCLVYPTGSEKEIAALGSRVRVMTGDLRDPAISAEFLKDSRGSLLIHTAGIIHPSRVSDFFGINVEATKKLLEAARTSGVARAVVVSSNSPVGCNPHRDHQFDEQSPFNPYMNYGRSKMLMEQAVEAMGRRGDIETVIMRPPWFYGPDQPVRQTLFFRMIRAGKAPIVGDGENLRSMGYVDNLAQGLLLGATRANAAGQTYWIADKKPYSMNEIVDTIERLLEQEFHIPVAHKRMRLPGFAAEIALLADASLQAAGLYHQKIHVLSEMNKTISCSIAKAERDLGYKPLIALEEGMRRSIQWCLERGVAI